MKKLFLIWASCMLLAAACDNGNASTVQQQAQLQVQQEQIKQEQQKLDQANVEKCAEQATKSPIGNPGTNGWNLDAYRNHFSKRLGRCFVLESSSQIDPVDGKSVIDLQIWDPYENTLYMECYRSGLLSTSPYEDCTDSGQKFPASDLQTHRDKYMAD